MSDVTQYAENLKALIDEWADDIEVLKAKIDTAATRAKGEYEKQMRELQARHKEIGEQIEVLKEQAEKAKGEANTEIEKQISELKIKRNEICRATGYHEEKEWSGAGRDQNRHGACHRRDEDRAERAKMRFRETSKSPMKTPSGEFPVHPKVIKLTNNLL